MALITLLEIKFNGNFQARMAVGMDPGASSPTDPYGTYGQKSSGVSATCAYQEKPFDRIIRLSNPVDLRNAQLYPWHDTIVHTVKMGVGGQYVDAPSGRPLDGRTVSLGDKVKWIEDEGYEIDGLVFSVGNFLVGRPTSRLAGWNVKSFPTRKADYQKDKEASVARDFGAIDSVRKRVLTDNWAKNYEVWATIYTNAALYTAPLDPKTLVFTPNFGGGATMDAPGNYNWDLSMIFSHWDADALCGRLYGTVNALHKSLLAGGTGAATRLGQLPGRHPAGGGGLAWA